MKKQDIKKQKPQIEWCAEDGHIYDRLLEDGPGREFQPQDEPYDEHQEDGEVVGKLGLEVQPQKDGKVVNELKRLEVQPQKDGKVVDKLEVQPQDQPKKSLLSYLTSFLSSIVSFFSKKKNDIAGVRPQGRNNEQEAQQQKVQQQKVQQQEAQLKKIQNLAYGHNLLKGVVKEDYIPNPNQQNDGKYFAKKREVKTVKALGPDQLSDKQREMWH
jgi:hypothetical protein